MRQSGFQLATFQGFITATTGSAAATIDASVSALQTVALPGGGMLTATIPAEGDSISNFFRGIEFRLPDDGASKLELRSVHPDRTGEQSQRGSFLLGENHLRRAGLRRRPLFDRRKRLRSVERRLRRLLSSGENNEHGHERESLESASRYHCCAQGNRFRRLLLAPLAWLPHNSPSVGARHVEDPPWHAVPEAANS